MIASGLWSALTTAVLFAAFVALCVWAFSPSQKRRWLESADLPFLGDEPPAPPSGDARHE